MSAPGRQPELHDLLTCLQAPTQVWSARDGQIRPGGVQGMFHGDVRVVSEAVLTVDGHEPALVMSTSLSASSAGIASLVRQLDDEGADPTFRVDRSRVVTAGSVQESVRLSTGSAMARTVTVRVRLASDLLSVHEANDGRLGVPLAAAVEPADDAPDPYGPHQVSPHSGDVHLEWGDDTVHAQISAPGARVDEADPVAPALEWTVTVRREAPVTLDWQVAARDLHAVVLPARGEVEWSTPVVRADDRRLAQLVTVSLDDLAGLRMATAERPNDTFLAAGTPWFFTLFGRDSLWAARFLLPLGTELGASTLRVLASRQGSVVDRETEEEPGKILHEVRRAAFSQRAGGHSLPPLYFGTVDATALWVCLLHDAWRWGMPDDQVVELLPALRRALSWMADYGDGDGDGLLEYVDHSGHGLSNQGWKDSSDSVQWRTGELAEGPIALCEVQGYAHEAALGGAAMLRALGGSAAEADRWLEWAARLAARFRDTFWVDDPDGAYPAIALDRKKRPVDALSSNIGHLLGTGLLDPAESAAVGSRLASAGLDSGFGLRTMTSEAAGYWPLRYHGGAVWPHDTAIAILGLARSGQVSAAAALADGLLAAAPAFDYRLPELYGGDARAETSRPVPYPAACRPQAWSAAASVAVLSASLGVTPNVPGGTLHVQPPAPVLVGALEVTGLRLAGEPLAIRVAADGAVRSVEASAAVRVTTG